MTKTNVEPKVEPKVNMAQRAMLLEQLEEIRRDVCRVEHSHASWFKKDPVVEERRQRARKYAIKQAGITRDVATLERVTKKLRDMGIDSDFRVNLNAFPWYADYLKENTPVQVNYEAIFRLLKAELTVCETCSRGVGIIIEATYHLSNRKGDKS